MAPPNFLPSTALDQPNSTATKQSQSGSFLATIGSKLAPRGGFSFSPSFGNMPSSGVGGSDCNDDPTDVRLHDGAVSSDLGGVLGSPGGHLWPLRDHAAGLTNLTSSKSVQLGSQPGLFVPAENDLSAGLCGIFGKIHSELGKDGTCTIGGTDALQTWNGTVQAYSDMQSAYDAGDYFDANQKFTDGMRAMSLTESNGRRIFQHMWQGNTTLADSMIAVADYFMSPEKMPQLEIDFHNSCTAENPYTVLRPALDADAMSRVETNAQSICNAMMARRAKETGCDAQYGFASTDTITGMMSAFTYASRPEGGPILNSIRSYLGNLDDTEGKRILQDTVSELSNPNTPDDTPARYTINMASTCRSSDVKLESSAAYRRKGLGAMGVASLAAASALLAY